MRSIRALFAALFIAGVLVILTGCGGTPATMASIPVHPEAAPLERGSNSLADTFANSLESSLAERGTVELKLYTLSGLISWEEIDGFYTEALSESDWKPAEEMRQESAFINTIGWMRGSLAKEQGLLVGYAPDSVDEERAYLIVALFSE